MREVSYDEYLSFVSSTKTIEIDGQKVELKPIDARRLKPAPGELTDVSTTVWSFPKRGSWATHRGDYRGNWAPQLPRALVLMYSEPGETVLDPMIGSGTTCIEARLLGRNCIGVDISYGAVMLTLHRLYWLERLAERQSGSPEAENVKRTWSRIYHGDARSLPLLSEGSVDLIATHPPYWNIIRYGGRDCRAGDLSCARSLEDHLKLMGEAARELYRVLKPGRHLGLLVGDTRVRKLYVPVSHYVLDVFLRAGFLLREEVIKVQHKMRTTREIWSKLRERDFLLIRHEKLFVLKKPALEATEK